MRYLAILFTTLGLAACSTAPVTRSESEAVSPTQVLAPGLQKASIDSVGQFLLTAAATDFRTHRPPDLVRFRDMRIGHVVTPGGNEQYMLCGQFLPAQEGGNAEWTPFATRSEERRAGKSLDLGGRRIIKKNTTDGDS